MCPALLYELCPKLKTKVAYIPFIWTEVKSCLNRYTYLSKLKIVILHKNCLQKLHFRVKCTLFKICWFICCIFTIQMPPGFNKSDFDHISWKTFTETWPYLFLLTNNVRISYINTKFLFFNTNDHGEHWSICPVRWIFIWN